MWWIKVSSLHAAPRWRAFAVVALAGAGLTACASAPKTEGFNKHPATPTEQYSLQVDQAPDGVALRSHTEGLSPAEHAALASLVGRWREGGGGEILVQSPMSGGERAARMASSVAAELQSYGIETVRIQGVPGDDTAPILVSFNRLSLKVPNCNSGWDDLASTGANKPFSHYGCAETANMAVMIANPAHVLAPADMEPADAVRRQTVLDAYRKGDLTSSKKDDQASGAVSAVGKQ